MYRWETKIKDIKSHCKMRFSLKKIKDFHEIPLYDDANAGRKTNWNFLNYEG